MKILWLARFHGVADTEVWNIDETAVKTSPVPHHAWMFPGGPVPKGGDKSTVTVTLCSKMVGCDGVMPHQVIWPGRTTASLPSGPQHWSQLHCLSDSHWQSTSTLVELMVWLRDGFVPRDKPFLVVLDCAPVHCAAAFRDELKDATCVTWLQVLRRIASRWT